MCCSKEPIHDYALEERKVEGSVIVLVDPMIARANVLKRRLYYYDGVYVPGEWQKTIIG